MKNFALRITKEAALYHVEIHFSTWESMDTWVCFEHFKRLRDAKAFIVTAMLAGNPFNSEVSEKVYCHLNEEKATKEMV